MKLAQLKQVDGELMAKYMKKVPELSRKLVSDDMDLGFSIVRGMKDQLKRE